MRNVLAPATALLLLAGCGANPSHPSEAVYYIPAARAPGWSRSPVLYGAPDPIDPPGYVARASAPVVEPAPAVRNPVQINVPLPGVPAGDDCGWWRLCNLPGWRYEN